MQDPYLSELKFLGAGNVDFIEVAVDAGMDVSNIQVVIYNPGGTVRTTNNLGSLDGTIAGKDVYTITAATSPTFNGIHKNGAVALVVDGNVISFLSFEKTVTATNGPASGLTSTQLGGTGAGESLETSDGGATYDVQTTPTPNTVPCFLSGTRILTDKGYRPVEALRAGSKVMTRDAGLQPVLWAGCRQLSVPDYDNDAARPIRVPAGAIGAGVPMRDTYLSANHRVVLCHPGCALFFDHDQVLAPIKALVGTRGIGTSPVALPIRYYHLLLERHHVIHAEGMACETFLPERVGLAGFSPESRAEICTIFPGIDNDPSLYGSTARMIAKIKEVRLLLAFADGDSLVPAKPEQVQRAA